MILQDDHNCHIIHPDTPAPQFILTESKRVLYETNPNINIGGTTLSNNLDLRIRELKESLGVHHPDVCYTISMVGDACQRNGDYGAALLYYTEALEIKKQTLENDNPSIADTLTSIGMVTKQLSMWTESEATFQAALHIYRSGYTDKSWTGDFDESDVRSQYHLRQKIISALINLGTIEFERKHFDLSIRYYDSALKESRTILTICDVLGFHMCSSTISKKEIQLQLADLHSNKASVHSEKRERTEAIEHYNAALNIQMHQLGEDDLSVACTLHNIGTMNYRSGDLNFALKSYKQVLKMRRLLLGPTHSSIADTLITIAMVHEAEGEFIKAESALSAASKVTAIAYGPNSQQAACVKEKLASVYVKKGDYDAAIRLYSDAIKICQQKGLEDNHPFVKAISDKITHISMKKSESASLSSVLTGFLNSFVKDNCTPFILQTKNAENFCNPPSTMASSKSVEV